MIKVDEYTGNTKLCPFFCWRTAERLCQLFATTFCQSLTEYFLNENDTLALFQEAQSLQHKLRIENLFLLQQKHDEEVT